LRALALDATLAEILLFVLVEHLLDEVGPIIFPFKRLLMLIPELFRI